MRVNRNLEGVAEDVEVLLFCLARGQPVACLARRHWFFDSSDKTGNTRKLAWQSTWDGCEIPQEWRPYAFGTIEPPDPAGDHERDPKPSMEIDEVL